MASNKVSAHGRAIPSAKECIDALHDHGKLFEMIADFPEACIYERFAKESALAIAYVGSKVHRCGRAAESIIREIAQPEEGVVIEDQEEKILIAQHEQAMDEMVQILLLYGKLSQ
jgi:hypothetical protein